MSVYYEPDPSGLREIGMSKKMSDAMVASAERALPVAKSLAPIQSGDYASSFSVEPATIPAGWALEDRAGAILFNSSAHEARVDRKHRILAQLVDIIQKGTA